MEKMRALVANDPRVYRELISEAFRRMRPLIETSVALPEELDEAVGRVRPHLIICSSRLSAAAQAACLVWVVLYPEGKDRAEIGSGGVSTALLTAVGLDELLSVVDESELRCRSGADR